MKELTIKTDEKNIKKLNQLAEYSKRSIDEVISDIFDTLCFMPNIVACEILEYLILQAGKCNENDQSRLSPFTEQRIKTYNKIGFLLKLLYNTQTSLIQKIEE